MIRRVLAPNPSPMTLEGTNTWLLAAPGGRTVVVDPGPDHEAHLGAVREAAGEVALVLLTHGHPDHSAGARSLAEAVRAPVRAVDPAHRLGSEGLGDGERVEVDELVVEVLATPGHSSDHVCFVLREEGLVLTGDHVLGRGTTVVAHPDGRMRDYLDSLRRLADVGATRLLPGHGPEVDNPAEVIAYYLRHREERLAQVQAAVVAGARNAREVVERVYADVDRALWPAAEQSVRAQLDLLVESGRVRL
ncbi:MAG TPA: MBL fold metallo-hydrolase [Mycobacteriales bacterium]|jgi:glyoxylase-like metal-dependent hydrolase (beta-lactamase superfamily II)|nr:MBL fold metallo-hydrolase [Mycobacteriales bacterium]